METRLLGYNQAASVIEITAWGNGLLGKELPEAPEYRVVRIIQFQLLNRLNGIDAVLLAEVEEFDQDMGRIALRAEDIQVIEQLTASIDEEPQNNSKVLE